MRYFLLSLLAGFLFSCGPQTDPEAMVKAVATKTGIPGSIGHIPLPEGYTRVQCPAGSFAAWLRELPLKKDKTVYLYNGLPKKNQSAQYAVIDLPRSTTDLQQCADVVIRLRAEYLFRLKKYNDIRFTDYEGREYCWKNSDDREAFEKYMTQVFSWCGSASLEKQLKPAPDFNSMEAGDVLIRGGFPGHAVIIADIAMNKKGEKIFLLVQGYQPAQDMHVLQNLWDIKKNPWYSDPGTENINTPEWVFYRNQLRQW
jgi:hypothetical protein